MSAHELAKQLLASPDLPVTIQPWGSNDHLDPQEVAIIRLVHETLFLDYDYDKAREDAGLEPIKPV